MPDFLKLAKAAASRGLKVTPLRGKAAFLQDWQKRGSSDEAQLEEWAREFPDANCGIVTAGQEYFAVDVDNLDWFMDSAPRLPKTLVVRTGSGKLHVYFKHVEATRRMSMRPVMNPRWTQGSKEPQKQLEFPDQCVGPGSVHPDTKRAYEVLSDYPVAACPTEWIEWLGEVSKARAHSQSLKLSPLKAGWEPEDMLLAAGLKYDRLEQDGKVYLNYHSQMGKCLVRGESHAAAGERPNPRQSAFVYDPATRELWHQCFSGGCQVPGKTRVALAALGIELSSIVRPRWRELFEDLTDFEKAPPLSWAIEGMLQEEGMTMFAGLSGHGKTFIMMAVAKALLEGSRLFQNFQATQSPNGVLYLIPEVGRRSFWKRLKMFGLEQYVKDERMLVRTMSMGTVVPLSDKRVLAAAKGRDVFLDTAVRFLEGEENKAEDNVLAETGFALLAAGARTWIGAHHSRKDFEKERYMCLENVLRGTGDLGAMLTACFGVRMLDPQKSLVHVECVKMRDADEQPRPFQLEGRPWLDKEGQFHMVKPPGECGSLADELAPRGGRPGKADDEAIWADARAGKSQREIAEKHGISVGAVNKAVSRMKSKQQELDLQEEA